MSYIEGHIYITTLDVEGKGRKQSIRCSGSAPHQMASNKVRSTTTRCQMSKVRSTATRCQVLKVSGEIHHKVSVSECGHFDQQEGLCVTAGGHSYHGSVFWSTRSPVGVACRLAITRGGWEKSMSQCYKKEN